MKKLTGQGEPRGCTRRQAKFVDLYLLSFNATKAYREAGYQVRNDNVASTLAARMLGNARVRELLAARSKAMCERTEAEQDRLMFALTAVAFADPTELVGYHRCACRYCYGARHRYQFTAGEWERKQEAHEAKREKALADGKPDPGLLDCKGGLGYDKRRDPHPDCPECFGGGVGEVVINDTRNLSPAGLALYAGVEKTKEGLRVKMHDQAKARELLARIHHLYEEGSNVNLVFNGDELSRKFEERMAASRARGEALHAERFGAVELNRR